MRKQCWILIVSNNFSNFSCTICTETFFCIYLVLFNGPHSSTLKASIILMLVFESSQLYPIISNGTCSFYVWVATFHYFMVRTFYYSMVRTFHFTMVSTFHFDFVHFYIWFRSLLNLILFTAKFSLKHFVLDFFR